MRIELRDQPIARLSRATEKSRAIERDHAAKQLRHRAKKRRANVGMSLIWKPLFRPLAIVVRRLAAQAGAEGMAMRMASASSAGLVAANLINGDIVAESTGSMRCDARVKPLSIAAREFLIVKGEARAAAINFDVIAYARNSRPRQCAPFGVVRRAIGSS